MRRTVSAARLLSQTRPFAVALRAVALLACLALLAPHGLATWSIIVVDRVTGEVVVTSVTCLPNLNLRKAIAVVVVGKGGACVQSAGDFTGANRAIIFEGLMNGLDAASILSIVAQNNGHQSRQYGIVDTGPLGGPVTFTGSQAGAATGGVTGVFGPQDRFAYAIQGNVLTDESVVLAAELALVATPGDLGQRAVAAMEAARALGGDGRCSCNVVTPTSCGAPPPGTWKSGHAGFLVIARLGDEDGTCAMGPGCANGDYFFEKNVDSSVSAPDPVQQINDLYATFRAGRAGLVDGHLSEVDWSVDALPADGRSVAGVTLRLRDIDGVALTAGGATVSVASADGGALLSSVGPVTDNGDGTYVFELTAGFETGVERLAVRIDDRVEPVTLAPYPEVRLDPATGLHSGLDELSAAAGGELPLTVFGEPLEIYQMFGSASGTAPGLLLPAGFLPLNYDSVLALTAFAPNQPPLAGTLGFLDAGGRARATVQIAPGVLWALVGGRLEWAAWRIGTAGVETLGPVGQDVTP